MKRLAVAALLLLPLAGVAAGEPHPAPDGYVVDTADALPPAVEGRLERELTDYARRTTNQVAVAVVTSLDGAGPADYGLELFNTWGVGNADRDNGVLLLVAVEDRATRIQTGLGVTSLLTDAEAQGLLDVVFAPAARAGNLPTAVTRTVAGIRRELGGGSGPAAQPEAPAEDPFGGGQAEPLHPDDAVVDPVAGPFDGGDPVTTTFPSSGFPDEGFPGFIGVAALAVLGIVVSGLVAALRGGAGHVTGSGVYFGSSLLDQRRRHSAWSSSSSFGSSAPSSHSSSSSFGGGSSGGGGASGGW